MNGGEQMLKYWPLFLFFFSAHGESFTLKKTFTEIPYSPSESSIVLGQAFDSERQKFYFINCVESKNSVSIPYGNQEAEYKLDTNPSYSQVLDRLSGNISAEIKYPIIRAEANAHYAREMSASEFSNSYVFSYIIKPKMEVLLSNHIDYSAQAQKLFSTRSRDIRKYCGDEFVSAVKYGGSLVLNLHIEYRNRQDKLNIGGKLNVKVGFIDVSGELSKLDEDVKKSVKITVQAIQRGGNSLELAATIPENIIQCTLEAPQPCFNAFTSVVRYAQENFKKQFVKLSDYNITSFITTRYEDAGLTKLETTPLDYLFMERIKKTRAHLTEAYTQAMNDFDRASSVLRNYYEWLDDSTSKQVREIEKLSSSNAHLYFEVIQFCYEHPNNDCLEQYEKIKNEIHIYQRDTLEVQNNIESIRDRQCEKLRQKALHYKLITKRQYDAHSEANIVPVFRNPNDYTQGIIAWIYCSDLNIN